MSISFATPHPVCVANESNPHNLPNVRVGHGAAGEFHGLLKVIL